MTYRGGSLRGTACARGACPSLRILPALRVEIYGSLVRLGKWAELPLKSVHMVIEDHGVQAPPSRSADSFPLCGVPLSEPPPLYLISAIRVANNLAFFFYYEK